MSGFPDSWFKSPRPTHDIIGHLDAGSHSHYVRGCRCDECKAAHAEFNKESKRKVRRETLELREHLARLKEQA